MSARRNSGECGERGVLDFVIETRFVPNSADVEKCKRKVEGDLKLTQEAVADLERNKKELEQTIQRKDKELSSLTAKLEDEQSLVGKNGKQIKELQARIEELEEEVSVP